jgi:branched-chain amino acid aminotransferase
MPLTKEDLKRIIVETVRKNNFRDAYIRPQISRGIGPLGCDPKREKCKQPTIVVYVVPPLHEARPISEKACTAIITSTRRNPPVCIPATIKATQYLNNILAKIESNRVGVDAAIMLDIRGFVSEGSGDNISMIRDGILINPPISCSILEGITRKVIMEIANELDIPVQESDIVPSELYGADEVFLSSTGSEITPIVQIDGRLIGNGKPGPTTTKIEARFRELVQTTGTPIYE